MTTRQGYNNNNLKYRNRGIVLQLIANNPVSRADITKRIGLTRMAITNIVSELIDNGYIKEGEAEENLQVGRNPIMLDISNTSPVAVGVYIGRNSLYAILTDIKLTALYIDEIPFEKTESEQSLKEKLYSILDRLFEYHKRKMKNRRIMGIGISSIGPFDPVKGILLNPRDFFGISNFPIKDIIEEKYQMTVYGENDMNAAALAEFLKGAGKDCNSFLYVGITNGVGAGIIVNRRLYGKDSISVGEIGHMSIDYQGPVCNCGNRGCLEAYATIPIIKSRLNKAISRNDVEITDFEELARIPECNEIFTDVVEKLSVALVNAVNLLDPECIVIGHEGVFLPSTYLNKMQEQIEKRILSSGYKKVTIVHSSFSLGAPLFGSAAIIINRLFSGEDI